MPFLIIFNTFYFYKSCFFILLTAKVWKGVGVSYFHEDPPGSRDRIPRGYPCWLMTSATHLATSWLRFLSQRKRFHPFGMEVSQGHDVRVLGLLSRRRASNIQPKPFPPLFNLRERFQIIPVIFKSLTIPITIVSSTARDDQTILI